MLIVFVCSDIDARMFPIKYMQAVIAFDDRRTYSDGLNNLYQLLSQVE